MKAKLLTVFLLLLAIAAAAEISNFALRREIVGATPGWAKIVVPDDLYGKLAPDMSDLRIAGVRANGERFEVPFLLRQSGDPKETAVNFTVLNQTAGNGGRFITFEVPTADAVNLVDLSFSKENFDWRVRLEGSSDQKDWFTIIDDYRIVAFKNNFTSYSFTTLRFPDAKYRYFRLFVPSADDTGFVRASLLKRRTNDSELRRYEVKSFKVTEDKAYRVSVIDIELANKVPMNYLKVKVADKIDFYRPVAIEYANGRNAENQPVYARGAADIFSSFDNEGFRFPVFSADRLRITVSNQDNPPLNFSGFEIAGTPYELVAQFPESAGYYLVYSKPDTPKPQYDINAFANKIPEGLTELKLGAEEVSGDAAPVSKPWISSPMWIWPVILIAIALMGFFAYRMLRKT